MLIADDDDGVRPLLIVICKSLGYVYIEARDGEEALDGIAAGVEVVVLDLMMPKVNGFDVLKAIEKMKVPPVVIILTAQLVTQAIPIEHAPGVMAVVQKPFDLDALKDLLRQAYEKASGRGDARSFG